MCANNWITEHINDCQMYSVECASEIKSIVSIIIHAIYEAVCVELSIPSFTDCENISTSSHYPHQIRSMNHLPMFRDRWGNHGMCCICCYVLVVLFFFQGQLKPVMGPGGRFKNPNELLNLRALKISMLYKSHIFQCMGKIFCVEFQRVPLKFHTKYLTHTLKDKSFMKHWNFKSS